MAAQEPLLHCPEDRHSLFPIVHKDLYEFAKNAEKAFWVSGEVKLDKDRKDWLELSDSARQFISFVLAFFSGAEGRVIENLVHRFHKEVELPEAKYFYGIQIGVETVHEVMYNKLINAVEPDPVMQKKIFAKVQDVPCIKAKADWAEKWISNVDASFASRVIAFACVEQIYFSASFAAIYWVKTKLRKLPGLCEANELIARDEGVHCDFAIYLYNHYIKERLAPEQIQEIVRSATEIEKNYVRQSLQVDMVGMSADLMVQYVEYVADRLLSELGVEDIYHSTNPFGFMNHISNMYKSNFFERRVTDYAKGAHGEEGTEELAWDASHDDVDF